MFLSFDVVAIKMIHSGWVTGVLINSTIFLLFCGLLQFDVSDTMRAISA